ncbi:MAG TPA: hypothetical protein VIH35_05000 [Kiritimatiellia bacterium]
MCVAVLISLAAASMMSFAQYQVKATDRARQDNLAMAIAEAGANAAYAAIKADFDNKDNASLFPETDFNNGYFDATVTSVGESRAQISCIGVSGSQTSVVVLDVVDLTTGTDGTDPTSPYSYTIFVNGSGTINGAGNVRGSVHCNQDLRANGAFEWGTTTDDCDVSCSIEFRANGGAVLHGMCYAPSINAGAGVPKTIQAVPTIPMPTLDVTAYYNTALANGQIYDSSHPLPSGPGAIAGGVAWYNGNLTINGGVSYQGCIIATGSINFKGGCTQTKVGNLPAVVSRDSSVTLSGARTMQGLVYSKGNFLCNGAGRLDGTVIVGGTLTLNGSHGIFAYDNSNPTAGTDGTTAPDVGISAWQK